METTDIQTMVIRHKRAERKRAEMTGQQVDDRLEQLKSEIKETTRRLFRLQEEYSSFTGRWYHF